MMLDEVGHAAKGGGILTQVRSSPQWPDQAIGEHPDVLGSKSRSPPVCFAKVNFHARR
jgi:hypothetical protein